jgi:hypothetical protein
MTPTVETDDPVSLMSALIVAGAGGGVTNRHKPSRPFQQGSSAEEKAGAVAASFKSAGQ